MRQEPRTLKREPLRKGRTQLAGKAFIDDELKALQNTDAQKTHGNLDEKKGPVLQVSNQGGRLQQNPGTQGFLRGKSAVQMSELTLMAGVAPARPAVSVGRSSQQIQH
jgi:hypothetical protein